MLRGVYQSGILTVLNSASTDPLALWESTQQSDSDTSSIKVVSDDDEISAPILSIQGSELSKTFITCPKPPSTLAIKLPYLVVVMKNTNQLIGFEVEVLDDRGQTRTFWTANYESRPQIHPQLSVLQLRLDQGWNHLTFDLAQMTKRAYGTRYTETLCVRFHASTQLRFVFFADRLIPEEDLPSELKLYN
ncbi:hypothetical protein EV179_000288 [Coemansia sp. RSA 487]|nr:hypothetical protein LPJ74_000743 [Coemansia sp. RSA 1843]KAJ2092701.1 hypothetical protein IW138_000795 [Coemansia sp. RSA 986]KAJ2217802.1 hypothetical protein EV179_000288 [Coemansia sp. RSA 487]